MIRKTGALLLVLLLLAGLPRAAAFGSLRENGELRARISALCGERNVPETLVLAVIERESGWDGGAVNGDGTCFGLMQINRVNFPALEEALGLRDIREPLQNVEAGIVLLSGYLEKYLDYQMALMCYNCGETGARRLWRSGCYSTDYSRRVIARMEELEWEALQEARTVRYLRDRPLSAGKALSMGETPW